MAMAQQSPLVQVNRRALINRQNGRKGGLATAKNHSEEWLKERGRRGGITTTALYSSDYFRHLNSQRKIRNGWPQGKMRKAVAKVQEAVRNMGLAPESERILQGMLQASQH
jgi:general stress protein YciG